MSWLKLEQCCFIHVQIKWPKLQCDHARDKRKSLYSPGHVKCSSAEGFRPSPFCLNQIKLFFFFFKSSIIFRLYSLLRLKSWKQFDMHFEKSGSQILWLISKARNSEASRIWRITCNNAWLKITSDTKYIYIVLSLTSRRIDKVTPMILIWCRIYR